MITFVNWKMVFAAAPALFSSAAFSTYAVAVYLLENAIKKGENKTKKIAE